MSHRRTRGRLALAAALAVAVAAPAAPAQASAGDCDTRLERLEAQFYEMADRRSYEAASDWWQSRWQAYFQSCVAR